MNREHTSFQDKELKAAVNNIYYCYMKLSEDLSIYKTDSASINSPHYYAKIFLQQYWNDK